jgi:sugar O-acyltransferase (sialic acid O-acetyltransferase NeuD family)
MDKRRDLLIVGDSAFAEVACEYFTHDSPYRVAGFAVERDFLRRDSLLGRPVVALEDAAERFPPATHDAYVATVYTQLNRLRARLCGAVKGIGYALASYVSSRAAVWPNVAMGEHCFIFENNVVQPFVTLGDDVVLWSGNHIGHHSRIGDHCFVSSHVVVSGFAEIGPHCFLGVNSAVANNVKVAADCWIGPGVTVAHDTGPGEIYPAAKAEPSKVGSLRFFKVRAS